MGRLYHAHAAGAAFLVNAEGRLDGVYYDVAELESHVQQLLGSDGNQTRPGDSLMPEPLAGSRH